MKLPDERRDHREPDVDGTDEARSAMYDDASLVIAQEGAARRCSYALNCLLIIGLSLILSCSSSGHGDPSTAIMSGTIEEGTSSDSDAISHNAERDLSGFRLPTVDQDYAFFEPEDAEINPDQDALDQPPSEITDSQLKQALPRCLDSLSAKCLIAELVDP